MDQPVSKASNGDFCDEGNDSQNIRVSRSVPLCGHSRTLSGEESVYLRVLTSERCAAQSTATRRYTQREGLATPDAKVDGLVQLPRVQFRDSKVQRVHRKSKFDC